MKVITGHLGQNHDGLWVLFLVGAPLQILETLWAFFRSFFRNYREKRRKIKDKEEMGNADNTDTDANDVAVQEE